MCRWAEFRDGLAASGRGVRDRSVQTVSDGIGFRCQQGPWLGQIFHAIRAIMASGFRMEITASQRVMILKPEH